MAVRHSLYKISSSIFLFLSILPVHDAWASKAGFIQKNDVTLLFDEPMRGAAEEVAGLYPNVKKELEDTFGWGIHFTPTVVIIEDHQTFREMSGQDLVVAFAQSERNSIVVDYSRMKTDPFTIESTLKHELCHLLLHSYIKGDDLPRWLDEGVCQWASGGLADIVMARVSLVDEAAVLGRYLELATLNEDFPDDERSLRLAYAESKGIIEYIIREHGRRGLLMILEDLKEGVGVEMATLNSLSVSLPELEERWHEYLEKEASWVFLLTDYLYEILFSIAALLAVYGFIKSVTKKRAYGKDDVE